MDNNNSNNKKIEEFRESINEIDDNIINLLNKRGEIVQKVGNLKTSLDLNVFQPARENEIIERIKTKSSILKPMSVEAIWREILSASKLIQGFQNKIGFLGPVGTFTHQAALKYFPKAGTEFISFKTTLDIFENIEKEVIDFGVVPIENSLQGTVRETLDLLIEKNLFIIGEQEIRIVQNLISIKDSDIAKIHHIISHPQAFAQAKKWLKTHLPNAKLIDANSTSEAVLKIRDLKDESYAAIGTEFSSNLEGLKILRPRIEDSSLNFTRFLIISKKENNQKEGKVKTTLVFVTKHVPGALYGVLKIFADSNINLLKIESRPRRMGHWEYIFLMDFEGDKKEKNVLNVLDKVNEKVIWYKILGSYPMR